MLNLMGLRGRKDNLVKRNSFDPDGHRRAIPRSSSPLPVLTILSELSLSETSGAETVLRSWSRKYLHIYNSRFCYHAEKNPLWVTD